MMICFILWRDLMVIYEEKHNTECVIST